MKNYSDEQLIADYLKKGDEKSLEILVQKYLKPVYNFAYRFSSDAQEAEDITQETFVKAWKNLKKFNPRKNRRAGTTAGSGFKTWIFGIAKNTAIDFLRRKKTIPFSAFSGSNGEDENFFINNLADAAPLPPEIFDRRNLAQELNEALEKLALKYRLTLFLRYNDHLTFRAIAAILGEPLHTIKSRHRRGLIRLKKLLVK